MNQNLVFIKLNGVGWNVKLSKDEGNMGNLILNVGYSRPVKIEIPHYLDVKILAGDVVLSVAYKHIIKINKESYNSEASINEVSLGLQRQKVGDFAATLRRIRPWNVYTGQGIIRMDRTDHLVRRRGKRN